jgi:hypothetical protein
MFLHNARNGNKSNISKIHIHSIYIFQVISNLLKLIIHNRDDSSRIVKWSVELGEFEIEFCPWQVIKS